MFVVYQSLKRPRYTLEAAHSSEMPAQTRSCDIPHNLNPKPNSRYYDFICILYVWIYVQGNSRFGRCCLSCFRDRQKVYVYSVTNI